MEWFRTKKTQMNTEVIQLRCVYLSRVQLLDTMDCSPPDSSVHGFTQAGYWSGFSSVQFSHSVMSGSLQPHELQHARPPCPSPTPRVHLDSRPLSQRCHPAISFSIVPFSSCSQSPPASGSFPIWVNSSHEVARVLEFWLQHQSFQWTPSIGLL